MYIIGIDIGGSTTKIVGFREGELLSPLQVRATDPLASVYGAFGRFLSEHDIPLSEIQEIRITGVGSSFVSEPLFGVPTVRVDEFRADALGGLYLTGLPEAILVSMGTGTAYVYAAEGVSEYLGGTGVGGGTLTGLSKKMLGMSGAAQIAALAEQGDLSKVDLRIGDITKTGINQILSPNATAANFGKLDDLASPADVARGIFNLIYETVGMLAVFAARQKQTRNVVLIGNLSGLPQARETFEALNRMFGMHFLIPELSAFGTVIGAALSDDGIPL
ncbi:MAG: type II pantothenate kinase [Clostridia bacterium]|nr:type II pantothenate kinase [Clostridia bacterium]